MGLNNTPNELFRINLILFELIRKFRNPGSYKFKTLSFDGTIAGHSNIGCDAEPIKWSEAKDFIKKFNERLKEYKFTEIELEQVILQLKESMIKEKFRIKENIND